MQRKDFGLPSFLENRLPALILLLSLALCFIIPSNSGLETDEVLTAYFARIKTFPELYHIATTCGGSDRQMPLTLFLDFAYEKLAGDSERALRSINIFWGLITITSFYFIGRRLKMEWLPLLMTVQPFYWYYMDQARPYAMLISLTSVVLYTVVCGIQDKGKWTNRNLVIFFVAGFLLSAASMMGFLGYIPLFLVAFWSMWRAKTKPGTIGWIVIAVGLTLLFGLGLYYLSTLGVSGGAKVHKPGIANILFPLHEFLGFSGLSPERFQLRLLGMAGISHAVLGLVSYLPLILPLLLSYAVIGICFLRGKKEPRLHQLTLLSGGLMVAIFLMILAPAFAVKFPVWGRHLSSAFPCYVLMLGLVIQQCPKSWPTKAAMGVLFLFLLISSCRLRFDSEYQREDFRSVSRFTNERLENKESVWWYVDGMSSGYYPIPFTGDPREQGKALHIGGNFLDSTDVTISSSPAPDWIVISLRLNTPDYLSQYIERNHYIPAPGYVGFLIYKKP